MVTPSLIPQPTGYEVLPGLLPDSWLAEEVFPDEATAVVETPGTIIVQPPAMVELSPQDGSQVVSPSEASTAGPSPQEAKPTGSELLAAGAAWLRTPSLFYLPRWLVLSAASYLGWWLGRRR